MEHDRNIAVRLTADAVVVDYHLEVDEYTVVFIDLPAVMERADLAKLTKPSDFYDAFARLYAPIIAGTLDVRLDGEELKFTCVERKHRLVDSLQCDYTFRAEWKLEPGKRHAFKFRESAYVSPDRGQILLSLASDQRVKLLEKSVPDEALQAVPYTKLKPGEEEKLRKASATFELAPETEAMATSAPTSTGPNTEAPATPPRRNALIDLLDSQHGFVILLALAAFFGAAHGLTPGHGKTLVAAYLVGERGTFWHAFLLGLVTTATHTGAVIALAALLLLFPGKLEAKAQTFLGLFGGLLVAGMGFWLLLRRLSGGADHVHIGGGHHHHHHHDHGHDPGQHVHDDHGRAVASSVGKEGVGAWSLVVLGVSGGIVPCTDAILMLGFAITANRLWLGLPLLLAFSAGLAGVLIAVGMAVVAFKGVAGSHLGDSRLFKALPIISALLVTALGLWLCYESLTL
jgi:ABC-type nickel/cobalt efflux system permease component RcnA